MSTFRAAAFALSAMLVSLVTGSEQHGPLSAGVRFSGGPAAEAVSTVSDECRKNPPAAGYPAELKPLLRDAARTLIRVCQESRAG